MKTATRLTKSAVLEQVKILRDQLDAYTAMSGHELLATYNKVFPSERKESATREFCIKALMFAATYHMTNVLGVE